ncbi:MAG: glycoside hydrolase family 38 N-terminal domain-containing protein [Anaerolineae bacterium]
MSATMKLRAVEPTILFARDGESLRQLVRLSVANAGEAREAWLRVRLPEGEQCLPLGTIATGEGCYDAYLPDMRQPADLSFALWDEGGLQDELTVAWQPQKHWRVHVVQTSHHDLGYTDLPSNLLAEHDTFYDDAIRYCRETEDWPEDCRFKYTAEQAWSVLHYLEHCSPEQAEALTRLIRDGRVEITALFGNETSELCGSEEQVRLLYPAFRLARRLGITIEMAELNDVPGVSWGLASVLAGAGVRWFAPRIPDYFSWGDVKVHPWWDEAKVMPRDAMGAFWWEGADGKRVLFWFGYRISLWAYDQALRELPSALARLEERGYDADMVRFNFQGGGRDNAPPGVHLSYVAREWNERWAYPRLIVSTSTRFFREFEQKYGAGLPTLRGDIPNTDYTVGATSTAKETAVNRGAQNLLPAAEKMASFAASVGEYAYPADTVAEGYDHAMLYDEHTWGMSQCYATAQEASFNQKGGTAYRAAALAHDVFSKATNRIVDGIALEGDAYHVTVFNPLSWARTDVARGLFRQAEPVGHPMYWRPGDGAGRPAMYVSGTALGRSLCHLPADMAAQPLRAVDVETGEAVPCQVLPLGGAFRPVPFASYRAGLVDADAGHEYELLFAAKDVPSCGYRTYRLEAKGSGEKEPGVRSQESGTHADAGACATGSTVENRYYRVTVDPVSGAIVSIWDKDAGRELVDARARHRLNQMVVRSARDGREHPFVFRGIRMGAEGPLYASLIIEGEAEGCPRVAQEIGLYAGAKRVDIANRVLRDGTPLLEVYFAFPFAVTKPRFRFEAPNSIMRPIEDQLPGTNTDAYAVGHWVEAAGDGIAVGLSSVDAPVVDVGDLWPGYVSQAHHAVTPPGYGHEFLRDPGQYEHGHVYSYAMASNFRTNFSPVQVADVLFRYAISSRAAEDDERGTTAFGWEAANPLALVYSKGPQSGCLPPVASSVSVDQPNVQVQTVKAAEDGDGLIVRLLESEGRSCTAAVTLPYCRVVQALRCDLVERNGGTLVADEHTVSVSVGPYESVTVRCRGRRFPCPRHLAYY